MNNNERLAVLMSLPVDRPGRMKTRDAVPFSARTLNRLCKPLSTPTHIRPQAVAPWTKLPRYIDWLRSIGAAPPKAARKRKPKIAPMFVESAPEAWRDLPADYANIERVSP